MEKRMPCKKLKQSWFHQEHVFHCINICCYGSYSHPKPHDGAWISTQPESLQSKHLSLNIRLLTISVAIKSTFQHNYINIFLQKTPRYFESSKKWAQKHQQKIPSILLFSISHFKSLYLGTSPGWEANMAKPGSFRAFRVYWKYDKGKEMPWKLWQFAACNEICLICLSILYIYVDKYRSTFYCY